MAEVKLTDKTRKMREGLACVSITLARFQETIAALVFCFVFFFFRVYFSFMKYPFVFSYAVS